jgi:hypothetical protein
MLFLYIHCLEKNTTTHNIWLLFQPNNTVFTTITGWHHGRLCASKRHRSVQISSEERSVYTFEDFIVNDACKNYIITDHPYRIKHAQRSIVQEIFPRPSDSPLIAYNAKRFEVLQTRVGDNKVLSGDYPNAHLLFYHIISFPCLFCVLIFFSLHIILTATFFLFSLSGTRCWIDDNTNRYHPMKRKPWSI